MNEELIEETYTDKIVLSNRDKKLSPKLGKFWCYSCDHYLVSSGSKCLYCGKKAKSKKRFKK